jgi:biopolymer transport protein ExbD
MKITRKNSRAEIPSAAMGDIAFNLIIFFVILANAQDDSHLQWNPAKANNLSNAGASVVSVVIDKDRDIYLNGQEIGEINLAGNIESLLAGRKQGDRTVLLKIHDETTADKFEPVIEKISEAGGELLHVVEEKEK